MDNFDYPAIGQRIKQLRKRKGLNQTELAQMLKKSLLFHKQTLLFRLLYMNIQPVPNLLQYKTNSVLYLLYT